jgi:tRNA-(ms[2]io[6]A)-hydroxylase
MKTKKQIKEILPLNYFTPPEWAEQALKDPEELLNDHAHLEKKAAGNALELLSRFPQGKPNETWVQAMTSIAKNEAEHLALVVKIQKSRGWKLSRQHHNQYAKELREQVRVGGGLNDILDRLIISALIEARSCERFQCLANQATDDELRRLFSGLFASEAGHFRLFLSLARTLLSDEVVEKRWQEFLTIEAKIIQSQAPGCRIHSGLEKHKSHIDTIK